MSISPISSGTTGQGFTTAAPVATAVAANARPEPPAPATQTDLVKRAAAPAAESSKTEDKAKDEPAKAEEIKRVIDELNERLKPINESVRFRVDNDSGKVVVAVVDTETDTVLRQIPTKEALAMSRLTDDLRQQGLLINTKA